MGTPPLFSQLFLILKDEEDNVVQNKLMRLGLATMLLAALAVSCYTYSVVSTNSSPVARAASSPPNFGSNVIIFDPSMSVSQIQTTVNNISSQQVDSEMGTGRYTLLFKPGTYGSASTPLDFQVGYYTEVAGLGQNPTDVVINGHVDVYNRCQSSGECNALDTFWRSLYNLTINVTGLSGCRAGSDFWAVSQAAPLRRVNITGGNLTLMDYCTGGSQEASGGFMADSQATTGTVNNGSQQQFLVRDSNIGAWSNAVWNAVFAGVIGAPAQSFSTTNTSSTQPYTTLATDPESREEPYLYIDSSGSYNVFVPSLRTNASGTTWANGSTPGTSVPISNFYIASPSDTSTTINNALSSGLNLIFTPGIYQLSGTIQVNRADTIVMGMGFPTLVPQNGITTMAIGDVVGVKVSGLLFDAGTVNSPILFQVGTSHGHGSSTDPTSLQDVFFRIGGATPGSATQALVVNSDYTILDDIWSWRADHGNGVGWTSNTANNGVVVNGDYVIATGLAVEHYQQYNLIWNGNYGKTIFFQNELPYDPPNQAAYEHNGVLGWAAYKVGDYVTSHEAWGVGSYCYFDVDPTIHAAHGFEVPDTTGIKFHDLLTVSLGGNGTIDHVINTTGAAAQGTNTVPVNLISYIPTGTPPPTPTPTLAPTATPTPTTIAPTPTSTPTRTPTPTATPTSAPTPTPTPTSGGGTNIALGKTATASSLENSTFPASNAVDGNTGTRWSSAFSDPQWLEVDLGATYNINQVVLNWEAAYGKAYQIQVSSDNTNWTTIYSTSNGVGGIETINLTGTGRYIRMYGTTRGTPYGYSLWEFQVYGTLNVTNVALNKTATASSLESSAFPASNAVDGNTGTRWSSAFSDPQWIQVDLGQTYNISKVVLNWEAAYGKAYQIQVSNDGTNWTTIYSTTNGAGGTETLNVTGSGRYVRMYGTARGTPYGYSLWEFQVFGS